MELNRRNFIKFVVGGVAGIHVTPLPWKLTDDIAIWTQNWPWVPVPPEGEFNQVKSVCTLCSGGCGIEVRRVDSRAVKIEGRTDYPVNPGGICPLGMGGLQLLYDKDMRFTGPMKRVGPRGTGEFKDITWEEALDILADRISGLRKAGRPEALAAVDGNPVRSTMSLMIARMLEAIGSPNYCRIPSLEDTYWMANALMLGSDAPMAYDLENADYVLSFGAGLLEGWGVPGRVINAWRLWHEDRENRKTKIVQVESRASNTASKSDQWVPARPGTESAVALGIAHVLVKEGLYDSEFVNNYSFGFDDWSSADGKPHMGFKSLVLNNYSPAQVAEIAGLDTKDILSLAMDFARAKAPLAIYGKGKGTLNGSLYECMAVQSLNALIGNINKPGGVLLNDPLPLSPLPDIEPDAIARAGLEKPRLDQAGGPKHPFARSLLDIFSDAIVSSPESPVETLLVFSANPAFTSPDGGNFRKALRKIPFIVSFSPYRDETAFMADLILPDHLYLEKMDDIAWPVGLQYPLYGLSKPVVKPIYDTRHTGDVLIDLAKRIGESSEAAFPWKKYEEVLKLRAKGLFDEGQGLVSYDASVPVWERLKKDGSSKPDYTSFDEMWKKLKTNGMWYKPVHKFKNWESVFKTPTGKFEFFSTQIELAVYEAAQKGSEETTLKDMNVGVKGDEVFMPHYEDLRPPEARAYPLRMIPYEMINLASGWHPSPPFHKKTLYVNQLSQDHSFADINPKTAGEHGLKQGDQVIVESPRGRLTVRANLFEGAMPGIVYLPVGFGHTAFDEFLRGKGVNPFDIVQAGKDPLSGQPVWWNTPVKLIKV